MARQWFLLKKDEEILKRVTISLFRASIEAGRDCHPTCPDYAQGFGHLFILKSLGLIDADEFEILKDECIEEAYRKAQVKTKEEIIG